MAKMPGMHGYDPYSKKKFKKSFENPKVPENGTVKHLDTRQSGRKIRLWCEHDVQ
jgi:hypothetical protein